MNWEDHKASFELDRSLRDIYVLHTCAADWQRLFDFLHLGQHETSYTVDGEEAPLPQQAEAAFAIRGTANVNLWIHAGSVLVCCHFFLEEEIEFDIDPREVSNQAGLDMVCDFMSRIGKALGKEVILTPESDQDRVLLRFPQPSST